MAYSLERKFSEKIEEVISFLSEEIQPLTEELQDSYSESIKQLKYHNGFYKAAFRNSLETRLRDTLRRSYMKQADLTVEEGLVIADEDPVKFLLDQIIQGVLA